MTRRLGAIAALAFVASMALGSAGPAFAQSEAAEPVDGPAAAERADPIADLIADPAPDLMAEPNDGQRPSVSATAPPEPQRPAISAARQPNAVVIELFTSQGCSSCPPADALFAQLAARQDVIALALHVDYWDYIGWADAFARPEHTQRQQAYARAAGSRTLYTPQIVVGGLHGIEGFRSMQVMDLIARHRSAGSRVTIGLARDEDGMLSISLRAFPPLPSAAEIAVVRYQPSATVAIGAGENAGRIATYHNIVTDWEVLGTWDGQIDRQLSHPLNGDAPVVVLVQMPGPGAIVGAARLR